MRIRRPASQGRALSALISLGLVDSCCCKLGARRGYLDAGARGGLPEKFYNVKQLKP